MWKSICVAGTLSAVVLSMGQARAADPSPTAPANAPSAEAAPPAAEPDVNPPAPVTTPDPTVAPAPAPLPMAASPRTEQPAMAGRFPDERDNQFVERGFGKAYPASVVGTGVLVGGGVQDFSRSNIRSLTNVGGFWSARLIAGTREYIGLEAAYVGSAQGINSLGLSNDAVLVSNGAEGALRFNLPIVARNGALLEPFAFGGLGWSRFHVARSSVNTSDIASNDDVLTVPYGAGLAFASHGFLADARFTYRSTFYTDLLQTTGGRLDTWSAGGQLGFEF
jgi:hypothetical protein